MLFALLMQSEQKCFSKQLSRHTSYDINVSSEHCKNRPIIIYVRAACKCVKDQHIPAMILYRKTDRGWHKSMLPVQSKYVSLAGWLEPCLFTSTGHLVMDLPF